MTQPSNARVPMDRLNLEFPRSLSIFDKYEDAQKAVDFLSDEQFPVQNVMIVGTDLRQVERVTGRLTWGKVLGGGILSGMWMGLFVGLILTMFGNDAQVGLLATAVAGGAVFGLIWAGLGYSMTRGKRDFTSVSQVVATKYELLVEHAAYDQAREILSKMPGRPIGSQGTGGSPVGPTYPGDPAAPAARPNPYEGMYGQKIEDAGKPVAPSEHSSTSAPSHGDGGGVSPSSPSAPSPGDDSPRPPSPGA
ncbi:MAG: hypothetical protein Q4G51_16140 [Dermatophilus congolensis]|nr:hypothetical protein [Dermatophilus congolensis]